MKKHWRDCRLGDVLTLKRGHDLPGDTRIEGDVPVVSSSGITGFHNEAKAQAPGVVTGRYGTIGEVFYLDQDYSVEAQELMLRNKPYEFFNPNDILYKTLIREIEESDYK